MKVVFFREDYNQYKDTEINRTVLMNVDIVIQRPRAFDNEEESYDNVLQLSAYGSRDDTIYVAFENEAIASECFTKLLREDILDLREYNCDVIRADDMGMDEITVDDFRDGIT